METRAASALIRWSPVGGLLFVLGVVAIFLTPAGEDTGSTAADIIEHAEEESGWIDALAVFGLLSILLLGWFVVGLVLRLRNVGATTAGAFALFGGTVFTLLWFVALMIWTAPLAELDDEREHLGTELQLAHAENYLAIEDIGWFVLGGGGVGAGVMIMASSLGARAAGLPVWAAWAGFALGVVALATVAFFGMIAWLAWIAIASVWMLARPLGAAGS